MEYFEKYTSNTYAGSGNQLFFSTDGEIKCGRIYYKISVGGKYNYSILFSNTIDSTFADGSKSYCNLVCNSWKIFGAKIGRCSEVQQNVVFTDLTFDNKAEKEVAAGEMFCSDPVEMVFCKGDYLCLEMTFSGDMIPYHEETMLPVFVKDGDEWTTSNKIPATGMIGCDRKVEARVGYFGDSITQGIGAAPNSYLHWNAILSEKIGSKYAFWNLGIGYGRASDAASDGVWLNKAKQNDIVFVCFGVNDLLNGRTEEQIKADLETIIDILKKEGKCVILQTLPPFDYREEVAKIWKNINQHIKTELSKKVDFLFDDTLILSDSEKSEKAIYGGHPNEEGCRLWAEALYEEIKDII